MKRSAIAPRQSAGFTLVELLVVIAIITILATIVTPRVTEFLERGRVARAVSDVKNADTSLNGLLSDAGVNRFQNLLTPEARYALENINDSEFPHAAGTNSADEHLILLYQTLFYSLLRLGREAALEENIDDTNPNQLRSLFVGIAPSVADENAVFGDPFYFGPDGDPDEENTVFERAVVNKLRSGYMQLATDPWNNTYNFWMGPLDRNNIELRSFRLNPDDPTLPYVWDQDTRELERERVEGQPPVDGLPGYPAPHDLPVYIWSNGSNESQDAHLSTDLEDIADPLFEGGGDDVNNWDSEAGWENAPRPE